MKAMKRISQFSAIILMTVLAAAAVSSCGDITNKTGNIGYNFGVIRTEKASVEEIKTITDAYATSFGKISGATVKNDYVYMEGKYSDTNAAVLKACEEAEKTLSTVQFSTKYTFSINVVYPSDTDSNFYVKTYGAE